ncbi:MAG: biotin/lipoyl-binding protein [Gammaproteobacteria bacterium]|jgi:multidrug efflux pump subunit AcrA (membrane-fusion protein)
MNRSSKTKNIVVPILILLFASGIFVGFVKSKPEISPLAIDEKVWGVEVMTVNPQRLAPQITLYGKVETPRHSQLTAAITADVINVRVKNGDLVHQGQVLVELDNSDNALLLRQREAELAEIKALIKSENARFENDKNALQHDKQLLELARQEYQRAQSLERNKLSTQANIDAANQAVLKQRLALEARELAVADHSARLAQLQARLSKAQALRDLSKLDIERGKITAPYAGKITAVKVAQGDRARAGNALIELYDYNALEIRAQIPIQYLNDVQQSIMDSSIESANAQAYTLFNNHKIALQLDRLAGEISQGSGGQDCFFTIEAESKNLPLGRTLEIKLSLLPVDNAIAVPRSAVYGSNRLYRYEDGRMVSHTVRRLGEYHDNHQNLLLIKDPSLSQGQQIVVTQLPNAIEGLKVKILETSL